MDAREYQIRVAAGEGRDIWAEFEAKQAVCAFVATPGRGQVVRVLVSYDDELDVIPAIKTLAATPHALDALADSLADRAVERIEKARKEQES